MEMARDLVALTPRGAQEGTIYVHQHATVRGMQDVRPEVHFLDPEGQKAVPVVAVRAFK
jgi:hypothetical protein